MAFVLVFCPNIKVVRLSTIVGRYMCLTICKPIHTHAQWRFALVFAVYEA